MSYLDKNIDITEISVKFYQDSEDDDRQLLTITIEPGISGDDEISDVDCDSKFTLKSKSGWEFESIDDLNFLVEKVKEIARSKKDKFDIFNKSNTKGKKE